MKNSENNVHVFVHMKQPGIFWCMVGTLIGSMQLEQFLLEWMQQKCAHLQHTI